MGFKGFFIIGVVLVFIFSTLTRFGTRSIRRRITRCTRRIDGWCICRDRHRQRTKSDDANNGLSFICDLWSLGVMGKSPIFRFSLFRSRDLGHHYRTSQMSKNKSGQMVYADVCRL